MTLFILTLRDMDDCEVLGVFATPEAAQAFPREALSWDACGEGEYHARGGCGRYSIQPFLLQG